MNIDGLVAIAGLISIGGAIHFWYKSEKLFQENQYLKNRKDKQ